MGLDYIGNSAISLQKEIDINLQARLCSAVFGALLDCSFPFFILVSYIRLVYLTPNFQIVAIVLTSLIKDTFCLQLLLSDSKLVCS